MEQNIKYIHLLHYKLFIIFYKIIFYQNIIFLHLKFIKLLLNTYYNNKNIYIFFGIYILKYLHYFFAKNLLSLLN